MKTGTKSILFGAHAFWYHPVVVWRAFRAIYGRRPSFWETVAIVVHDWGYWGKGDMDGPEGKEHPLLGADLVSRVYKVFHPADEAGARFWARWTVFHSRHMATIIGEPPSELCWADKASIYFEPSWFYLLRVRLSGEIKEFRLNAIKFVPLSRSDRQWLTWLRARTALHLMRAFPILKSANP